MSIGTSDFDEAPRAAGIPVPAAATGGRQVDSAREGGPTALAYGSLYEEPSSPFDPLKIWGLVLKHRWLVGSAIAAALCIGLVHTLLTTPIYRATTTIQINREAPKVVTLSTDDHSVAIEDAQFYQTEYELLKSRSLAERVVADLDLGNQPSFLGINTVSPWTKLRQIVFGGGAQVADKRTLNARKQSAIGRVQHGLTVSPVPNSALVRLSYNDSNPAWAQKIVNAVGQAFIKTNLERRYDATSYARNFLQDQLADIKLKLEQSERELVAYAQKEGIINLEDKQPPLAAADLLAINNQLAQVRAQRIENEQLWHQAQTTDGLGLPQILSDGSIQALRSKLAELQTDYQDKLNTFKPDFPDMRKLQAQMNEINRQIQGQIAVIKRSIEAKYEASKQQEELLTKQLGLNKDEVLDVQNRNIEYTILQREVDTNRTLYNALLQRYKDVGVDSGIGTNNISVVDQALMPGAPFSPDLKKNMAIALLLGVLAASAGVYILELLDDTFKTPEQVEEELRIPVLGLTPLLKNQPMQAALADPHSHIAESFRSIRTALQFSTDDGVPKSLLVTSSHPSEGKSTASLALARNFAQLSMRVLLIDADLRKPSLHKSLDCDNSVGLSNFLAGGEASSNIFRKTSTPGLMFMASGPLPPNPAELLSGPKLLSLLTFAHQKFDLVIIDGPPIVGLADALLIASVAGGTLMVVGACETSKNVVKRAMNRLHFARARLIGAMLSKFDARKIGFEYGYGYGYGYGYSNYYYDYGKDKPQLTAAAGE